MFVFFFANEWRNIDYKNGEEINNAYRQGAEVDVESHGGSHPERTGHKESKKSLNKLMNNS